MKFLTSLALCVPCVGFILGPAPAQEAKSLSIPFPLPTRVERLAEEAQDPKTPVAQLLELVKVHTDVRVREAAANALVERGDQSVLTELEKLLALNVSDGTIAGVVKRIKARLDPEAEQQKKAQATAVADEAIEFVKAHQPRDTGYSEAMLRLAETGDRRALPLLEEYLSLSPLFLHDPLILDKQIVEDREKAQVLYWGIKLQGLNLKERVAAFIRWANEAANPDQVAERRPISGIHTVIVKQGPLVVPLISGVVQDQKMPVAPRREAAWVLAEIQTKQSTLTLLKIAEDPQEKPVMREVAVAILTRQGNPKVVNSVLRMLLQGSQEKVNSPKVLNALYRPAG